MDNLVLTAPSVQTKNILKESQSGHLDRGLACMEAPNRKQPVPDKQNIFEELQDLVSDQLKVCHRLQ